MYKIDRRGEGGSKNRSLGNYQVFKVTVVNLLLPWGSLEITLTVLLSQKTILIIINYSFNIQFVRSCLKGYTRIWDVYQMLYKNLRCLSHVVQEFEMFITCCARIWDVYHMLCKNLRCLSHVGIQCSISFFLLFALAIFFY